jgi:hypothetical protein
MGMDFIAINREVSDFHLFSSVWCELLEETGCGYLLGYGKHFKPAYYVYDRDWGSPISNDGMEISARDAEIMSRLCDGYIFAKTFLREDWDKLSGVEKKYMEEFLNVGKDPNFPYVAAAEFLEKVRQFSDFAKQSGGFEIW